MPLEWVHHLNIPRRVQVARSPALCSGDPRLKSRPINLNEGFHGFPESLHTNISLFDGLYV
jgi:hypothetical protein